MWTNELDLILLHEYDQNGALGNRMRPLAHTLPFHLSQNEFLH